MDDVLKELIARVGTGPLERAVSILDGCISQGVIERALGNEADGLMELVDARDIIIDHIAAEEEGDSNDQ